MAGVIFERVSSQALTVAVDKNTGDLEYMVYGTDDIEEVQTLVEGVIEDEFNGGIFESYDVRPLATDIWVIVVRYSTTEKKRAGDSVYTFDTTAATQHIRVSRETIADYAPEGETAGTYKQAINYNGETVEGTDILAPTYSFSETHYFDPDDITPDYKATLFALTTCVNDDDFKGFKRGEVLFLGASGSKRGTEDWEITFKFMARPNLEGVEVGDIVAFDTEGWFFVWYRFDTVKDPAAIELVQQPSEAHVERVYEYGDMSLLGLED